VLKTRGGRTHFVKDITLSHLLLLLSLIASQLVSCVTWGAEVDLKFIANSLISSSCNFDSAEFSSEFSKAVDRLNTINPTLVRTIRAKAYLRHLTIDCDVSPTGDNHM
jgi:hypothetical protein